MARNNFTTYESGPGRNSKEWGLNCCRFSQIGEVARKKPLLTAEMKEGGGGGKAESNSLRY